MAHKTQGYFGSIAEGFSTLWQSLVVTFRHLYQARRSRTQIGVEDSNYFNQDTGIVTLQYPFESFPIPDNGRYRLHNEIEDCIVCDLCAKICPVDCIDITAVKSTEEIGKTSDGTTKRLYAAQFDIDMAKCCYCGLCTTVCPTECLTMTKTYDYSEFDVTKMVYHFTDLSPEEAEQKKVFYDEAQKLKASAKANLGKGPTQSEPKVDENKPVEKKPFKPFIKPQTKKEEELGQAESTPTTVAPAPSGEVVKPKIVFKPKISPNVSASPQKGNIDNSKEGEEEVGLNTSAENDQGKLKEELGDSITTPQKPNLAPKPQIIFKPKITIPAKKIDKDAGEQGVTADKGSGPTQDSVTGENLVTSHKGKEAGETQPHSEPAKEGAKPKIIFKPKIPGISKKASDLSLMNKEIKEEEPAIHKAEANPEESFNKNQDPVEKKAPIKPVIKPKIPGLKKPDASTDDSKN
ncbi:MAG TPA: NADH-quinone oxidoreductase subunit I [Cytophagaceae bacterium]|jgi:NADH-quinone oxidoreductase subunit I